MSFNRKKYYEVIKSLRQRDKDDKAVVVKSTKYFTIEECYYRNVLVYV